MKRYFIAAYNHDKGFGNITMATSGYYPSQKYIQQEVLKILKYKTDEPIVVINVIELNEAYFNDWIDNK